MLRGAFCPASEDQVKLSGRNPSEAQANCANEVWEEPRKKNKEPQNKMGLKLYDYQN